MKTDCFKCSYFEICDDKFKGKNYKNCPLYEGGTGCGTRLFVTIGLVCLCLLICGQEEYKMKVRSMVESISSEAWYMLPAFVSGFVVGLAIGVICWFQEG